MSDPDPDPDPLSLDDDDDDDESPLRADPTDCPMDPSDRGPPEAPAVAPSHRPVD